jgi:hypothetical protein
MKASSIMIFEYMGMLGVPVLLLALALSALVPISGTVRTVLLLLIGAGCLVYGAIAVRDIYVHGGKKRETTAR